MVLFLSFIYIIYIYVCFLICLIKIKHVPNNNELLGTLTKLYGGKLEIYNENMQSRRFLNGFISCVSICLSLNESNQCVCNRSFIRGRYLNAAFGERDINHFYSIIFKLLLKINVHLQSKNCFFVSIFQPSKYEQLMIYIFFFLSFAMVGLICFYLYVHYYIFNLFKTNLYLWRF